MPFRKTVSKSWKILLLSFLMISCSSSNPDDSEAEAVISSLKEVTVLEKELNNEGWKVKNTDPSTLDLWDSETSYPILLAQNKESNLLFISFFPDAQSAEQIFNSLVPSEILEKARKEAEASADEDAKKDEQKDYIQAVVPAEEGTWVFRCYQSEVSGYWTPDEDTSKAVSMLNSLELGSSPVKSEETTQDKNENEEPVEEDNSQDEEA